MNNKITLNLSGQRINELLRTAAEDFSRMQKSYTVSVRNNISVLRTYVLMQKNVNLLDCRISIHPDNGRTSLKITYTPSVFLLAYLMFFLLAIILSKAIFKPLNFEALFCILLFIAVPALVCIREMDSYKHFWSYFRKNFTAENLAGL